LEEKRIITKIQEFTHELKVHQVMTGTVASVSPGTMMSGLRGFLHSNHVSYAPVVENDNLVGIIGIDEILNWLEAGREDCTVSEKMNVRVETVFEDSPLVEVMKKYLIFDYGCYPVIRRDDNKLVGVITRGDIVQGLLKRLEVEYLGEEVHSYRASHFFEDFVSDKASVRLEYYIQGKDFQHAGECSSSLKKTLKRLGISPRTLRRIAIATYEAEMNMIIYADKGEIIVNIEPDSITITAEDSGPGIEDIEKAMTLGFSTASDWVRDLGFGAGMGLINIKSCSDELHIDSTAGEGTRLEIKITMD